MKRDLKKLQEKWERVLEKYGLGINQPLTDNSDGTMANPEFPENSTDLSSVDRFIKLRSKIDGDDGFMAGHEVKKIRRMWEREIPDWTYSKEKIQKVLLSAFPKLLTSKGHKNRAARWAQVINLYYRMELPMQVVAKEIGITVNALDLMLRRVNKTAKTTGLLPTIEGTGEGRHGLGKSAHLHLAGNGRTRAGRTK